MLPSRSSLLMFVLIFAGVACSQTVSSPPSGAVTLRYFGMHIHRANTTTPWPSVPFGSWRLWDAHVQWPWLEPKKGEWHFEVLDKDLAMAEQHNVDVLYPFGLSPQWTSARPTEPSGYQPGFAAEPRMDDWRDYVRRVATRYKGRIHYYEIWNEPNLKDFYTGTPEQLVALAREAYKILKEVDPSVQVVSPSATGKYGVAYLDKYLKAGGREYADIIGYHFYVQPNPPEDMLPLIADVKSTMAKNGVGGKPLWNTECGWDKRKAFNSDEEAYSYMARAAVLNWVAGVSRYYWYAWDNASYSLRFTMEDSTTPTNVAKAFEHLQKWLLGARLTSCSRGGDGVWTCRLTGPDGTAEEILWHPDHRTRAKPDLGQASKAEEIVKGQKQIGADVEVGLAPVLLQF